MLLFHAYSIHVHFGVASVLWTVPDRIADPIGDSTEIVEVEDRGSRPIPATTTNRSCGCCCSRERGEVARAEG